MWPDWTKLYAAGNCLHYGVPFSDEQWTALNNAKNEAERNTLVNQFRAEYQKEQDKLNWVAEEFKAEKVEETVEETAEEVKVQAKPAKSKKGK